MSQEELQNELKRITEKIIAEYQPEKIILFGSYAWGQPHEWSDVDLLIVKESDKPRLERQKELRKILFPPALPLDLLVYSNEEINKRLAIEDFFIKNILNDGKVLYETK